jgi:UPF0716 protein FxsA
VVLLPLVVLFVLVPIAELAVIIQVGQVIGVWWTIALLIADSVLGSVLMRSQGRAAWRRFRGAMAAGRVPAREVLDGALVIFGGALLLTPGFITDILGLLLLVPPTRAAIRAILLRRLAHRMIGSLGSTTPRRRPERQEPWPPPRPRHYDVDGAARDAEPPADRLDPPAEPSR